MRKPEKAAKLVDYLEERLVSGYFGAGTRIPSVRRLSGKFGVSYGTALRGIDYLCALGKLEKIPQRGIFVRKSLAAIVNGNLRKLAVFMRPQSVEEHSGMFYMAFLGMQAAAYKSGFNFLVNPLLIEDATEEIILERSEGADGVVFLNEYDSVLQNLRLKMPAVGILMENTFGGAISTVNLDPVSAAYMAVDYFTEHGVKSVKINSSIKPVFMTRGRMFESLWRTRGGALEWLPENEPVDFQEGYGYLFTSDQRAQNQSEIYMERTGRMVADDFTILGMDGKQLIDPDFHRFPSIVIDWKKIGEIAFKECVTRIDDVSSIPKNIMISGELQEP
jgi:DNA-binding LacI/PurR family transcriptional regulator